MNYWLFKSEPEAWGWQDQKNRGAKGEHWDGVRNYQANNHMKLMKIGDYGFFYHSVKQKSIVGIVKIIKQHYPDHTDPKGRFGMVDIMAIADVPNPVSLDAIKANSALADIILVKNSRLSVQPVLPAEWDIICLMGGVSPSDWQNK
ncbi:MAG: EVE domain-containing protein [Rhizobiales bacterium]|nr:EVE domain-containing protein [Hyphomicrobiales bacterium]NRB15161.1 EVE domain-containing protein [Hyphomicrobiales bacterium]